ncbi:MAG: translation initiation factor IF-2 N-terminal domain-containing protein, partial [Fulvivirga sp.]
MPIFVAYLAAIRMRLSQLARKLGVTQTDINELLLEKGFEAPEGGNSKLTEEQVTALYKHFDIPVFTEPEELKKLEPEVVEEEVIDEPHDEVKEEDSSDKEKQAKIEETPKTEEPVVEKKGITVDDITEENIPSFDVVRAKKVKLEGIKVIGKIDLPEPKPKPDKKEKSEEELANHDKRSPRRGSKYNKGNRRKREPLTFEQKQRLEEKKRLREKEEREKKLKEKKKAYF